MRTLILLLSTFLPWGLRRPLLERVFGYRLHASSHIGLSLVMPRNLVMGAHARIGHFTVCKGLDRVELGELASIGRLNWISAFPTSDTREFTEERKAELIIGEHSHITHRHILDCTNSVHIGRFSVVGGYRSQYLTHAVDLEMNRQRSKPITIGDFSFAGTGVIVLGGAALPSYSMLAAGAVLNKDQKETHRIYAGVPARPVKTLAEDLRYFSTAERLITDSPATPTASDK
jgi:acetyltransferase-like isoleucine patch superfamily enzyme